MKNKVIKRYSIKYMSGLLMGLFLGFTSLTCQAETVFEDDFSEANGTAINGKSPDIGSGTWWSDASANQVNAGAFTPSGGNASVSFSRALVSGEFVTISIDAGAGSSFRAGGWTGVTMQPWGGGGNVSVGDTGSNNEWVNTGTDSSTSDSSAPNTVTITYAYDSGAWTIETSDLPGFASGTITAGLAMRELKFWDDGSDGSAIEYDSITVDIDTYLGITPYIPSSGYVGWAYSHGLTAGRYGDPDGDGLENLGEYALSGDPTNLTDRGYEPIVSIVEAAGADWLHYIYPKNVGATDDVEFSLELNDNLASNNWVSTGYTMEGTESDGFATGFDAVTNQISTEIKQSQFVRLRVDSSNPDEWRGGDISLLPTFEALGGQYKIGEQVNDPIHTMMNFGMNTFRVRLFVNPTMNNAVVQDLAYVTALGLRIKNAGGKFLLNIHYSDTWADPGNQSKPDAWTALSFSELETQVETYSSNVITTLKQAGCLPDMVQVGNEITGGFLWPDGGPYQTGGTWSNFITLLKAGIRGVKKPLSPGDEMEVMVHIDRGGDLGGIRVFYDQLVSYNVDFDVIGLSYYPWWHGTLAAVEGVLYDAAVRYGKEIIIVETAFPWDYRYTPMQWAQTPAGQKQYLIDLMAVVRSTPNGLGKGVVWWYPEAVPINGLSVWEGGANALFKTDWTALPAQEVF